MTVRLRLSMKGRRHDKIFHLVAIDIRRRRDAKPIEMLGIFDPRLQSGQPYKSVQWSVDRIKYWLGVGALPSKPVVRLLEMGQIIPPNSKYHPKALGPLAALKKLKPKPVQPQVQTQAQSPAQPSTS